MNRTRPDPDRGQRGGPADAHDAASAGDPAGEEEQVFPCDLCGAAMINRHCKLACPQCGYQRDCSDP